jgi:hypothetical protein
MEFDENDFDQGIELGTNRAQVKLENSGLFLPRRGRRLIRESLERYQSDLNGRFVELFVELATLASITRQEYDEAELTGAQMDEFLEYSILFFNSFTHRVVDRGDEPDELVDSGAGSNKPATV